ncbi:hypothetical protein PR048_023156 [Dryococelus australis]|uniref:acid phosphatase n=1 Tax=Dryococelus australis TaxID=614101 RepID=A0ABQ9GT98_9NEOP|nr:hypothetical protein PR048_023156 [Dryococelus australis]
MRSEECVTKADDVFSLQNLYNLTLPDWTHEYFPSPLREIYMLENFIAPAATKQLQRLSADAIIMYVRAPAASVCSSVPQTRCGTVIGAGFIAGLLLAQRASVSRADEGEMMWEWSSARMQGRGKREIPEKTRRPETSSGKISTCENPGVVRQGIEPGSPWWEASRLTAHPPRLSSSGFVAGPLLKQVRENVRDKLSGALPQGRALHLYSGHDFNIICLLQALGVYNGLKVPYSSAIIFELQSLDDALYIAVRLYSPMYFLVSTLCSFALTPVCSQYNIGPAITGFGAPLLTEATVAERLACSPPTVPRRNGFHHPAGSLPDFSHVGIVPDYAAGGEETEVRRQVWYRNNTEVEPHLLQLPRCDALCPLEKFEELIQPLISDDWESECAEKIGADAQLKEKLLVPSGVIWCVVSWYAVSSAMYKIAAMTFHTNIVQPADHTMYHRIGAEIFRNTEGTSALYLGLNLDHSQNSTTAHARKEGDTKSWAGKQEKEGAQGGGEAGATSL